jgi:predicted ester cyclase
MNIPPTYQSAHVSGISMLRFTNGQVVEEYSLSDMMTLFQQLGLAPSMS